MVIREFDLRAEDRLITVTEFLAYAEHQDNSDRKLELINGVMVEEMSPGFKHGNLGLKLISPIQIFAREHNLGEVSSEVDHYTKTDDFNSRRPDFEFISKARLSEIVDENKAVPFMPDLAIEIKSPGNTYEELRQKAAYYLQNGCRMVWLLYPVKEQIAAYTLDKDGKPELKLYGKQDILEGGDVLPGFALPLNLVFDV